MVGDIRSLKRRHLIYYLEVYDQETGKLLGHLVDITTKGIKLVSKEKVEVDKNYNLKMMLPEEYFKGQFLSFSAHSLWSSNDINPDFFDTGFEVSDLDENISKIITRLINRVGFND